MAGHAVRPNELVVVGPVGLAAPSCSSAFLAGQTWLLREPGSGTRATTEAYLEERQIAPGTLTVGSNVAVCESVAVGLGVTLISRDAVPRDIGRGVLAELPAPGTPLRRDWCLVSREGHLPAPSRLFVRDRPPMTATALVAADLVLDRKGILAADESGPAMDARLRRAGVAPGAESRRAYREMLVTTPGLSLGISGVILGDETFRARMSDGRSFPEALAAWHGDPACAAAGQRALAHRVACNVAALQGRYTAVLEPSYVLAGYA